MLKDRYEQVASLADVVPSVARAGDAGRALAHTVAQCADRGMPVMLVSAEAPRLPRAFVSDAVESLRSSDAGACGVVLGPATGGGCYLIGVRDSALALLRSIDWDRAIVADDILAESQALGLDVRLLEPWPLVAGPDDLERVRVDLWESWWPKRTAEVLRQRGRTKGPSPSAPSVASVDPADLFSEAWVRLSSRPVYATPWISVREDHVRMPDGNETIYSVVEMGKCIGILAFADDDTLLMVRQYRYAPGEVMLEIPKGGVHEGEAFDVAAQRELAEEAQVRAGTLEYLGKYNTNHTMMNETVHIYVARDLVPAQMQGDDTEFIRAEEIPFARALEMVLAGEILDSVTIVALLRAARDRGQ